MCVAWAGCLCVGGGGVRRCVACLCPLPFRLILPTSPWRRASCLGTSWHPVTSLPPAPRARPGLMVGRWFAANPQGLWSLGTEMPLGGAGREKDRWGTLPTDLRLTAPSKAGMPTLGGANGPPSPPCQGVGRFPGTGTSRAKIREVPSKPG